MDFGYFLKSDCSYGILPFVSLWPLAREGKGRYCQIRSFGVGLWRQIQCSLTSSCWRRSPLVIRSSDGLMWILHSFLLIIREQAVILFI